MLKRLQLIDPVHLTAARIISILADDDPNIRPLNSTSGADIRLDIEVKYPIRNYHLSIEYLDVLFGIFRSFNCLCTYSSR